MCVLSHPCVWYYSPDPSCVSVYQVSAVMRAAREGSRASGSSACSATTLTCARIATRRGRQGRGDTAPLTPCSASSPEWMLVRACLIQHHCSFNTSVFSIGWLTHSFPCRLLQYNYVVCAECCINYICTEVLYGLWKSAFFVLVSPPVFVHTHTHTHAHTHTHTHTHTAHYRPVLRW